jgi:6-phosphogluconolactonase
MMQGAPEGGEELQHPAPRLWAAATVARMLPSLWGVVLMAVMGGACGRSIFPSATSSAATATATPGTGAFLYVSNNDGKVAEFKRATLTGILTFVGTVNGGAASGPFGIAAAPTGNFIYVANTTGGIHQYSFNRHTGKLAVIGGGTIAAGNAPRWVAVNPAGTFAYATNFGGASISPYTINAATGALSANGSAVGGPLASPYADVADDSFLFVSDRANSGTIISYPINADGSLGASTFTSTVFAGTGMPGPLIIDPSDQFIYVTDVVNGTVSLLSGVGTGALTLVQVYPTSSPGTPAVGLALAAPSGGNEFLYVANQTAGTISLYVVTPTTGALTLPSVATFGLNTPTGLAVDPSGGFLYVTNQSTGTIATFAIDATTGALTAVGSPLATEPSNPNSKPLFIAIAG